LNQLIKEGRLELRYPSRNHPAQAYSIPAPRPAEEPW
jgi:hypothetical protein